MTYPWRRAVSQARSFVQAHQETRRNVIVARAEGANPGKISPEDATSIALGVTFSVLILALVGLGAWFFLVRQPKKKVGDIESGTTEKKNWWMVSDSKGEKGSLSEWWRKSYAVPDRVEPPPSAAPRSSLQRLRSVLTRKGALRGVVKKSNNDEEIPSPPPQGKITSPTMTIDLPMQTVPQLKPRYPSVLERGYRVPLYPTQSPPKDPEPRSLTSPAPLHPITVAERTTRRKVSLPPRALKISNGRPLVSIAERKLGLPRSPAHRRRGAGLMVGQFKHPFMPLKDSDTDFPTISAPMPSTETEATNPKLGYAYSNSMSRPRVAPAPGGPRVARASTRRVPVPILVNSAPIRPLMPATPRHLREESKVNILPPGQSPTVPRAAPTPI